MALVYRHTHTRTNPRMKQHHEPDDPGMNLATCSHKTARRGWLGYPVEAEST